MQIIIAPCAARLFSGKTSPKNYPHFDSLVRLLNREGYQVIQIGVSSEEPIEGVSEFLTNLSFPQIADLVRECGTWISVDSWLPHMVHCEKLNKRGVVLFGLSDPRIFGYSKNINILRGRNYLRQFQYQSWEECPYDPQAFVYAENVIPRIMELAPLPLVRKASV